MVNRIEFLDSVSGIQYPEMLVKFFDHFIALKQIVEDSGSISVDHDSDKLICFGIQFDSFQNKESALRNVQSGSIVIYNRPISISVDDISDVQIKITLQ